MQAGPGAEGDGVGGGGGAGAVVSITKGLDDTQVREALGKHAEARVLRFTKGSMAGAFRGFAKAGDEKEFRRVIASVMGIWCCVRAPTGHIWYDMMWDVVPHTDRHNRKWDEPWTMRLGP